MPERQPDAREDVYFVLTSLAHVVATVLFGEFLNLPQFPGLLLVAFAMTSKAFALFAGENERFFRRLRWASVPLAVASLAILAFLPILDIGLGLVVMLLYVNYPRLLRARERSPLDVLFHGSRYAILFWIGYGGAANAASVAGVLVVFFFGVAGELLVGLRTNREWRTTAARLGVSSTVRVVNILTFALILLGSFIFSTVVDFPIEVAGFGIPVPLLSGVAVALFITRPVSRHKHLIAPVSVRRREVIVLVIAALLFFSIPLTTRVDLKQQAPQQDYSVSVGMQLIVTGPHPWDGQWVIFNFRDPGNYYYILLHTDGTLELSQYVNGTAHVHIADVQTGLSPFNWHHYDISVVGGVAKIAIDGRVYITATVQNPGGEAMVSQTFPTVTFWVVSVTQFSVVSQ